MFDIHAPLFYCLTLRFFFAMECITIMKNRVESAIKVLLPVCLLAFCLCITGCDTGKPSISQKENRNGISETQIRVGSSLALGGHAGYLGTQMLQGAMSYINHINDRGGIHGRKIKLIALDDGYDPPRTVENTRPSNARQRQRPGIYCTVRRQFPCPHSPVSIRSS